MERTFGPLLLAIILMFCSSQSAKKESSIIFTGKIENPNTNHISLLDLRRNVVLQMNINEEGTFQDTFFVVEGYYYLEDGNENTTVYLKPGFHLNLHLNTTQFDESIIYSGMGAVENNYLAKKALILEDFGKLNYYGFYTKLSEANFLSLADSLYSVQKSFLMGQKNMDAEFKGIELKTLSFNYLQKISNFEGMKRYLTEEKDFQVSDKYPNAYADINLTDEKLLKSPAYLNFVASYLRGEVNLMLDKYDEDYTLLYAQHIVKKVKNIKIKEALLYDVGKWELDNTKELEKVYDLIQGALKKESYLTELSEKYQRLQKVQKGQVSPTFELKDSHDNVIKLEDLKGKLVYIDVWATWCMPCLVEIPHLKELEAHFKGRDIEFVSICAMDTEESWRKMVAEKELRGIQLFAPDLNIPFLVDYMIYGVPKFILLDEEGIIIDANVSRPSDPSLIEMLEKLL
ncbi:hypothetical protein DNU06_00465 [Putridiphycobacter roseus]|uniref:Thioredoxin domain-containing protein n=1 Tax=Putridiphycobacter roseus TaxID=2219161 RepID=A0A2W1NRS9_9FLAO|nr:TlpA disulfide reductase family protein [Putridiphycobacter roseus]PZE18342.1 hypothetical protein DNU06_00465 [Putridiphycobacter roseus]